MVFVGKEAQMTTLSGVLTMDMASAKSTETKVTTPSMELTISA